MKAACLFLVVMAVTSAASGAIKIRRESHYDALWVGRITVSLVNDSGTVTGWRGRIYASEVEGFPPEYGPGGLNQVLLAGEPTPSLETAQYLDELSRLEDTHFLFLDSQIIIHEPPTEGRVEQPDGEVLTELWGDFEIKPEFTASVVPLVQVTYRIGHYAAIDGWAMDGEGQEHRVATLIYIIPEPASAGLMLGCMTLLALRRRRRGAK